jgi:outer membrane usher protein
MAQRGWIYALIVASLSNSALSASALDGAQEAQEALLEVSLNGETQSSWSLVMTIDGSPWVRRGDLRTWGVQLADENPAAHLADDALLPLNGVPGVHASIDLADSRLDVDVQPALLTAHRFRSAADAPRPMPSPWAAFANYDVGASRTGNADDLRALTEVGIVNGNWVARSSWFATVQPGQAVAPRLDTNVTLDFPETRTSLQFGDTFATLGANAEAVRVAGFSWATDFSLTPTFITIPLPTVNSLTASASTVDLYVNGSKTQQLSVPGGPYSISGVPVTTGAGELTVVTHDLSGRTETFTQSYYIAPQMLAAGLSAWDIQAGAKRRHYGIFGDQYSGWLADVGQRVGMSDHVTASWRVEADETGVGASAQWLLLAPHNFLLSVSPSCALASAEAGCLLAAGLEHDSNQTGFGIEAEYVTSQYQPVAAAERGTLPRWQLFSHAQAEASHGFGFAIAATWREDLLGEHSLNVNFSASKSWFGGGHVDFVLGHTVGPSTSSYFTLVYTRSLGIQRTLSAQTYANNGQAGAGASLQHNLPVGTGYGYLLQASQDHDVSVNATAEWNADSVALAGLVQREGERSSIAAQASGALLWLDDEWVTARQVSRSFAILHAADLSGLPVYLNEQQVAITDAKGLAVLPDLRPFEVNHVALDATTLPLSIDVSQLKFDVIPYRRGGAFIEVPVRLAATVRLRLADGRWVPAGARIQQGQGSTPVGNDGEAYVQGAAGDNELKVEWQAGRCLAKLHLPVPIENDSVDDVITLLCVSPH